VNTTLYKELAASGGDILLLVRRGRPEISRIETCPSQCDSEGPERRNDPGNNRGNVSRHESVPIPLIENRQAI
jgi:hypothetical protein